MKQISKFIAALDATLPNSASTPREQSLPAVRSETCSPPVIEAKTALNPATPKEMAVALNELISIYGVPAGWDVGARIYREMWGDLPADVLFQSIRRYMASSNWFPKPAEILALAAEEMRLRKTILDVEITRARTALPKPEEPVVTPEEIDSLWEKYGGRTIVHEAVRRPEPHCVTSEIPETIAGKPWR